MTDTYLAIAAVANDYALTTRVTSCAAQQGAQDPEQWTVHWRYTWASAPGWGAAWDSALVSHPEPEDPPYSPGSDPTVITDGMILGQVQAMLSAEGAEAA